MLRMFLLASLGLAAGSIAADKALDRLAGRYTHTFKNGNVDGDVYRTTDIVEILPLNGGRAIVNLDLNFFNGHSCSVAGVATLQGNRLIYREDEPNPWSENGCRLEIWRDRNKLKWTEGEGTSCQSHCGARGGLSVGDMPYSSRRKISPTRAKLMRESPEDLVEH